MSDLRTAALRALEACEQRLPLQGQAAIIDELNNLRTALAEPGSDYERGFVDGMSHQAKSSVDRAVNRMVQQAERKSFEEFLANDEGVRRFGLELRPEWIDAARAGWDAAMQATCKESLQVAQQAEPVAWVNHANLQSAAITRARGGQGDTHTWSETPTAYHSHPLYTAPPAAQQAEPVTELQWAEAPWRTEYGHGMMEALVALGKDHTLRLYAEADALHLVVPALESIVPQQVQREPVAWIDDSGHPKHRLYLQSATERKLYGPLRPLYEPQQT